jgi:hypothetical protein
VSKKVSDDEAWLRTNRPQLRRDVAACKQQAGEQTHRYATRVQQLPLKLCAAGSPTSNTELIDLMVIGITPVFQSVKRQHALTPYLTFIELQTALTSIEQVEEATADTFAGYSSIRYKWQSGGEWLFSNAPLLLQE